MSFEEIWKKKKGRLKGKKKMAAVDKGIENAQKKLKRTFLIIESKPFMPKL